MPRVAKPRWSARRGRWYANVGEPDGGGRAREVFAPPDVGRNDEAKAWAWFEAEKAARASEAAAAPVTFERLAELYLADCERRVAEDDMAARHYENRTHQLARACEYLGGRAAAELGPADVERTLARLRARFGGHHVANIAAAVQACFRWAVGAKHLAANPVAGFATPAVPDPPERFGTRLEAAAWLGWLWRDADRPDGPGRRFGRLAVLLQRCLVRTGARPGELCALRWGDLDWDGHRNRAGLPCVVARIPPSRWKAGRKTGRWRVIYFSPGVSRALRREAARPDRHPEYVFVHGYGQGGRGEAVPWQDGSKLSQAVRKARRRAIAARGEAVSALKAGLPVGGVGRRLASAEIRDDGPQRLCNYRWRHTAASTLLMSGVDAATVAKLLGTSAEMVHRVYGHLLDRHVAAAAEKLARPSRKNS